MADAGRWAPGPGPTPGPVPAARVSGVPAHGASGLLTALQYGDGQFPGGGFAFSWGLESLVAAGRLARADFADYLHGQMAHRWAACDRILMGHAHGHAVACTHARADNGGVSPAQDGLKPQHGLNTPTQPDAPDGLDALDALAEALATVEAARTGSRRAGLALLGTHVRLGTPGAAALRARADRGAVQGHLPVVQGVVLAGTGLGLVEAMVVSGYTAASALATAAIRLGLIGHLDAQAALQQVRPLLAALAEAPLPALDDICTAVPEADLAMMRHADLPQRLFSN